MAYSQNINESAPTDDQSGSVLGDELRDLKRDIRERLGSVVQDSDTDPMVFKSGVQFAGTVNVGGAPTVSSLLRLLGTSSDGTTAHILGARVGATDADARAVKLSAMRHGTTVGVAASTILDLTNTGAAIILVWGLESNTNAWAFADALLFIQGATSFTSLGVPNGSGAPPSRTYTRSGTEMQLAIASGTASCKAVMLNTGQ